MLEQNGTLFVEKKNFMQFYERNLYFDQINARRTICFLTKTPVLYTMCDINTGLN